MGKSDYDYRELAYDLYHAADDLLDRLVAMRKRRHMTQAELAEEMNVSQSYISQIENGRARLTDLLTDYALEVGARIEYSVEPAEAKPQGRRYYEHHFPSGVPITSQWTKETTTGTTSSVTTTSTDNSPYHHIFTIVVSPKQGSGFTSPQSHAKEMIHK